MSMDLLTDPEFQKTLQAIANEVGAALTNVMNDARDTLKKHIDEDVYDAGYEPKVYKRRSRNDEMGVSLGAQVYQEPYTRMIPPSASMVNRNFHVTSRIYYNPSGEHKYPKWDTASYNDLIGRIEKKSPAYTWGQDKVPARPFWQRFVDEMVDGGELEKSFVSAMAAKEIIVADGNVTEDPFDRDY